MPYYGDALPYYYGGPFSNHSSLMTGTGRSLHSPLSSSRYAPHLSTISESPLSALRRYSPAATITSRPKRVIDTADIDVSTPRALSHSGNQRNRLRRDRPTIRIRSQALKDNPALREHYERHEKTVGELLVEKFLIKDKKPETESEFRPKLYHQISLDSAESRKVRDDLQEALNRRVTRRMTRRRSSADIQMDPEQIEREVLFAQAQADALDTLVAEEQAEIEVETRMGTLIRKNLVRSVLGKHENQLSGEDDDESRSKKLAKKVKKRKKTTDKPSPPSESELESEVESTKAKKAQKEFKELNQDVNKSNGNETIQSIAEVNDEVEPTSPTKGLKFKIEASNSVGDFSTLWINAGAAEEHEKQRKKSQGIIEQFRDSVRLPAPKSIPKIVKSLKKEPIIVEDHQQVVVLPVKKRYVKDDSRNSVYLTLKTPKIEIENSKMTEEDDEDGIVKAVDSIDESMLPIKNGIVDDARQLTSFIDSPTTGQSSVNKVAKFRSKDITESDIEVKSISELPGGVEGTEDGALTKDGGLQKLSELVSATRDEVAKKSIGPSNDREDISGLKIKDSLLKNTKAPSNGNARGLDIFQKISVEEDIVKDNETTSAANAAVDVLKSEKKESKVLRPKIGKITGDSGKKIKRSTSALEESSSPKIGIHFERSKSDEKRVVEEIAKVSPNRLSSSTAKGLPNGSTIDKACEIENNSSVNENGIKKLGLNEDLPVSRNISGKFKRSEEEVDGLANFRKGKSKTLNVIAETKNESPKKKDVNIFKFDEDDEIPEKSKKNLSIVNTTIGIESQIRKNGNIVDFEEDKLKKTATSLDKIDGSEISKFQVSQNLDDKQSSEMRPESQDLKVVIDSPKKIDLQSKKPIVSTANEKKLPESPENSESDIKKKLRTEKTPSETPKDTSKTAIEVTIVEDSLKNDIDSSKIIIPDSPKLTNGVIKKQPKIIEEIKETVEIAKPEIPKLKLTKKLTKSPPANAEEQGKSEIPKKTWKKPETSPLTITEKIKPEAPKVLQKAETPPADEGIDFWGEISSQRVEKPVIKLKLKDSLLPTIEKDKIPNSNSLSSSEPEVKSNPTPETSSTVRPKTPENLIGDEKKTNKIKKKKTVESPKKKNQEKPSEETIFERFINGDGNKLHQQQQQNEQTEKSLENDKTVEISCEILEVDRFDRNLSTIAEEGSPVSEEVPKKTVTQDDIIALISSKKEESKLDLLGLVSGTGSTKKTESKEILPTVESEFGVPEVKTGAPESRISEVFVPSINVEEVPGSPTKDQEFLPQEPEIIVEEEEEGPGTPTNEPIDEVPKNISKWNGRADLSLDEPDKDIGPEVYFAAKQAKKGSSKKKSSTKKGSSKKGSIGSPGESPDSSKKRRLPKKKKLSGQVARDIEKKTIFEERSESKLSNSSDSTLKPSGLHLRNSPNNSPRNSPKQRPLDLIKMFYTTPASLLTATPRDLSKVKRAKIKKKKHSTRTASASSDSTGSTRSTQSTVTSESTGSTEHEDDPEHKRISSTRSNDSGFDGSPRLSSTDSFGSINFKRKNN